MTTGRETETVTLRTAANRLTAYETTRFPDGQESKRTTWPDGTESFTRVALDDSTVETSPDGTVTTLPLEGGIIRVRRNQVSLIIGFLETKAFTP